MWSKPYKIKEGIAIGIGLFLVGLLLEFTVGSIDWDKFSSPINIIVLALYILFLFSCYLLRKKVYVIEWTMTLWSAIPSMCFSAIYTIYFGITNWTAMLSFWSFVLTYLWMMNCIGLISIRRIIKLFSGKISLREKLTRDVPFVLNHLGLFIALTAGTLGNADLEKYDMTTQVGTPEWRVTFSDMEKAKKAGTAAKELPLAIELHDFSIEEYPIQLVVLDNETGKKVETSDWVAEADSLFDYAAPKEMSDSASAFVRWPSLGATSAAHVIARNNKTNQVVEGWVSNGSFMFPFRALRLDKDYSLVMPEREPKRFASDVTVYCESGEKVDATIEVNKPLEIAGWKIYQLSYDEAMGRWSTTSIFQLVRDPWLPYVYLGIYMMLLGAVCLFVIPKR